ncbi:MAG: pyridoxal-phosphate dependent enzyme [Ferruginibacter sp.]
MLFPGPHLPTQIISDVLYDQKQLCLSVLRLDAIHPVISGNKLFKLHYFLQEAQQQSFEGIVTFGGPYSNHLVAAAYACKAAGIKSLGIIRGELPALLSHTLLACMEYGMSLRFMSRQDYNKKEDPDFLKKIQLKYNNFLLVPEGGYHPLGAAGASLIMNLIENDISHICCAVGTATTAAGLLQRLEKHQQVIAVPVLKNMHDLEERVTFLTNRSFNNQQLTILNNYHFGGYAKKTEELIDFMNLFYQKHKVPTDFVYTGKMMFAVNDLIKKDFFPRGSKIICLHTGGLQGNLSLKSGVLCF